ncbi:MAG: coproporphyrinogen dehydrogenase HemZ [Clostridia bacterium]|nr:coproporphyrinogen dehydrogenase HemZ [Clostridia bacterium]
MLIVQNGYECNYELTLFYKLFFDKDEDIYVYSNFEYKDKNINVYTEIIYKDDAYFEDYYFPFDIENKSERLIKKVFTAACTKSFCHAAKKIKNINLPWGVMCGIRPAKNVRELIDEGYSDDEVVEILKNIYEVSDEKTELARTVAENEKLLLSQIGKNSVSVYIGIPFCPTRCLYCSFVSTDVRVSGKYMDEFVEKLLLEIDKTAEIINKLGVYVENIYIGGGTPTTLSAEQLTQIFTALKKNFDFSKIKEFTLEAGRVDTITKEKLAAAKKGGVNRISINPQTMNDVTLKKVRRAHNSKMIRDCFYLARDIGFDNINMDLIAGLPDETVDMFRYSLDEVIKLNPENITVHSMCIKRAASLRFTDVELTEARHMNEMLSYTQKRMKENNMDPYYMYRQKNILGNLENVGYAKKGTMSAYNINIMEEKQTIIALGGGGSTKLVMGGRIERIFNFKDPLEYIRRFDEILKKKDEIIEILNSEVK